MALQFKQQLLCPLHNGHSTSALWLSYQTMDVMRWFNFRATEQKSNRCYVEGTEAAA